MANMFLDEPRRSHPTGEFSGGNWVPYGSHGTQQAYPIDTGWRSAGRYAAGPSWGDGWRPIEEADRIYYDANPTQGYQQYTNDVYKRDSGEQRYAQQQYQQMFAGYLKASESNPALLWTDYLTPERANELATQYQQLGVRQRGENNAAQGPRITW